MLKKAISGNRHGIFTQLPEIVRNILLCESALGRKSQINLARTGNNTSMLVSFSIVLHVFRHILRQNN